MSCKETDNAGAGLKYDDPEHQAVGLDDAHLFNSLVRSLSWSGVDVTVKDRESGLPKKLVDEAVGEVKAGEICALMGPSGCGKTTLLNVLARRPTHGKTRARVLVNGTEVSELDFRQMTCFVEQEDALIGSLTVRETLEFASRLANTSSSLSRKERARQITSLLSAFGLTAQSETLIGTPIRKGISGGQKRRVGVASQLITSPKILFLDEPTSGLDSAASREVVSFLRDIARRHNLLVLCSIHQPSTSTFNLFDKLVLLSGGKTHYFGPVSEAVPHYQSLDIHVPNYVNPAEFLLDLVNVDFVQDSASAVVRLEDLHRQWIASPRARSALEAVAAAESDQRPLCDTTASDHLSQQRIRRRTPSLPSLVLTLLHRSFIKSYRDIVAYGIRVAMYTGLAIMMGTVWLRLSPSQESIQPFINAIFFGSAFMSFMAVAYVPAFLEDRLQYVKEHRNGLYDATAFIIANFLIGAPYLFFISVLFSIISYWLSNFHPTASAFFTWVMWLFLDLLAAESLVVLMSSIVPSFVISLALVAFANGLWMSVGGFMVPPTIMNAFYKYVFYYWDYQRYVFEGMMVNEFEGRVYSCGDRCRCIFDSSLADRCAIDGRAVLSQYGYSAGNKGKNVGIMIAIIAGYRLASWLVLKLRQ